MIQRFKKLQESNNIMMVQQLICDQCKIVLLEKDSKHLNDERFPITEEEAKMIDRDHRGHECHIELVEKFAQNDLTVNKTLIGNKQKRDWQ